MFVCFPEEIIKSHKHRLSQNVYTQINFVNLTKQNSYIQVYGTNLWFV